MSLSEQDERLEEGPIGRLFGSSATTKILDFLSTHEAFDYSINEIAEYTGVHRRTVSRVIPTLEYYSVVKKIRKIDRSNMYKMDKESEISSLVRKLGYFVAEHDVNMFMNKDSHTTTKEKNLIPPPS